MLLALIYEENGPVEYHPLRLSTYCGMREATFVNTLEKRLALGKITLRNGMLSNGRAERGEKCRDGGVIVRMEVREK